MYNPDYLERPHVVVLNKIDLPEVSGCTFFPPLYDGMFDKVLIFFFRSMTCLFSFKYVIELIYKIEILFQASNRIAYLMEKILNIGTECTPSEVEMSSENSELHSSYGGKRDDLSLAVADRNKGEKQIEDYPLPLAVVAVSVL